MVDADGGVVLGVVTTGAGALGAGAAGRGRVVGGAAVVGAGVVRSAVRALNGSGLSGRTNDWVLGTGGIGGGSVPVVAVVRPDDCDEPAVAAVPGTGRDELSGSACATRKIPLLAPAVAMPVVKVRVTDAASARAVRRSIVAVLSGVPAGCIGRNGAILHCCFSKGLAKSVKSSPNSPAAPEDSARFAACRAWCEMPMAHAARWIARTFGPTQRSAVRVLIVEDDDAIAAPLMRGLEREGFEVQRVASGEDALAATNYELVLLDLGLPGIDGFEVCRTLRARSDVPIIVTTARGEEIDRVVGLELGADDYVVKPYGLRELVARMRAVTRRLQRSPGTEEVLEVALAGLVIDRRRHSVSVNGEELVLTPKEYELLEFLARDPGAACTRDAIIATVWDEHWFGPTKTLDVHIASLRKKLGNPDWIETIRGVGFRLSVPDA